MKEDGKPGFLPVFAAKSAPGSIRALFFYGGIPMKRKINTRQMVMLALLAALAYVAMMVGRVPVVLWLKYDPKDVILAISGFLYGPVAAFATTSVVAFVEMISTSDTGFWGLVMNILSSCTFACTAAAIYRKKHTQQGALIGLICGVLVMVPAMLMWNYFFTPIYMGQPREAVADLLIPYFLPFNAVKGGLNAAITLLVYKPVVKALRAAGLVEKTTAPSQTQNRHGVTLLALALLLACVAAVLVLRGVI